MSRKRAFLCVAFMAVSSITPASSGANMTEPHGQSIESVILLHGLCRTSRSMAKLEHALTDAGYSVWNVNYPSRTAPVEILADEAIGKAVADCRKTGAKKIDFVTHSMGGIMVRSYLARHEMPDLGRVVMLAPPNQGSEVVDKLARFPVFRWINGPAGMELGTTPGALPAQLGPAHFSLGIIAGDRSINWINSLLIPGVDDGKVSIARAKLRGMHDFMVIHAAHPFIMRNAEAIRQTIQFLQTGRFKT